MTGKTLTRADIAETINQEIGLSRNEAAQFLEEFLEEVTTALTDGEEAKFSKFGTFVLRDKNERIGRNPKTGVEVPITPRRVVVFRASHVLKDMINGEGE